MSKKADYMILELDGQELYIQATDSSKSDSWDDGYHDNSLDQSDDNAEPCKLSENQLKQLIAVAGKLFDKFKEFRADEMEISFSIKADAETKLFWLAKADVEGQFGVKLKWKDSKIADKKTDDQ